MQEGEKRQVKASRYPISYVRTHVSEMIRRVEGGEEIEVTKRGVLMAKLIVSPKKKAR